MPEFHSKSSFETTQRKQNVLVFNSDGQYETILVRNIKWNKQNGHLARIDRQWRHVVRIGPKSFRYDRTGADNE